MKFICSAFIFLALAISSGAQNWAPVGNFNNSPRTFWHDEVNDRLLVAGGYSWFDSTQIMGYGWLHGDTLLSEGCGFGLNCGIPIPSSSGGVLVSDFEWYNGKLYVVGYFDIAGGVPANGVAIWGSNDWVPIGTGLTYANSAGPAVAFNLESISGELYLYGQFDTINGVPAHSIAKFDGANWSSVFDFPRFSSAPNFVYAAEWFQGELYVGGNFSSNTPYIRDLVKWDGTNWVKPGPGLTGGLGGISTLDTYKGKLYIGGHFNRIQNPGSIPGNNIVAWDGVAWDTLNGGLWGSSAHPLISTGVNETKIYNGELYVCGSFNTAGGSPIHSIAKWDGNDWCGPNDYFEDQIRDFEIYHDTVFVTIGYGTINGDSSLIKAARWIGGTIGTNCQWPVGLDPPPEKEVRIFPNPVEDVFQVELPPGWAGCNLELFSPTGRKVLSQKSYHSQSPQINIGGLADGLYLLQIQKGEQMKVIKLLKQ